MHPVNSSHRAGAPLLIVMLMLAVAVSGIVLAQPIGKIAGRVLDASGAIIVGAEVTVTDGGGVVRHALADHRGAFEVAGLAPGEYVVRVGRAQFRSHTMAVRLGLGAPETSIELVLSPAGPSEDVTVAGHAPYAASDTTIGKTAVPRRRVPNSVSVLTRAQMNDQNMVNTWDALSQITGITAVSNDGSQAQFHARGAALESQQDGIPSEMALSGNQQYDLAIYDRVEVLRGPAGVLQGAGAFAGTVNLVRKRPKPIFSTAAWASTGQWNNHHVEAEATGTLFSSVRGLAVVAATDREFFFERGWDRKWLGYGALEWDLRRTTIGFTAAHQRDRTPGFSGLPSYTDGGFLNVARSFNPYPSWNRYAWDTTDVGVDVSHRFTPAWRLVAKVNRRTQGFLFHDSYADDGVSRETQTTAYARRESRFDYSVNSADAYLEGRFAVWTREQEWLVGTNISRFASVGRGVSPSQEPSLRVTDVSLADPPAVSEPAFVYQTGSDSQRQQWGLYTLLRSRLTERVTSVLGGRWTNYDARSRAVAPSAATAWAPGAEATLHFTPYAGAVVDVMRDLSAYASYAEIFSPTTSRSVDGNVLDPRIGHQWGVGAKGEHVNGRLLTSLAAFDIRDRNRAYPDPDNVGFFVPLGEVESRGIETEIVGRLSPAWDVSTGYTWLETKYLVHQTLRGRPLSYWYPRHSLKLWSTFRLSPGSLDGARVGIGVQAYSKTASGADDVNAAGVVVTAARRQSGYAVASVNLSYPLPRNLLVTVQVNNVFDRTYYTRLGGTSSYNTFGDPRNLFVSLRWRR